MAINEELKRRDLSEVSTPKLFEMMVRYMKALDGQIEVPEFLSEAEIERNRDERILANHGIVTESAAKKKKELEQSWLGPQT